MRLSVEQQIQQELSPGERLLWSGRPGRGVRFEESDRFVIPFSLVWCGTITVVVIGSIRAGPDFFSALFHVPFVLIGLYMIPGRFVINVWGRRRTVYGLTDMRALIDGGLFGRKVESLPLQSMPYVMLSERGDGSGTISFGATHSWSISGEDAPPAFAMIEDARRVNALIRQTRAERKERDSAPTEGDEPGHRWDLSAPESEVLLMGPKTDDGQALKLALLELVVCGALKIVPAERSVFHLPRGTVHLLAPEPYFARPVSRCLRSVLATCVGESSPYRGDGTFGVPVAKVAYRMKDYYDGYVLEGVLPELEDRGLYTREQYRRLRFFSTTRWVRTSAGEAITTDLDARMAMARQLYADWRALTNRNRAPAAVEMAGAQLLLMPRAHPKIWRDLQKTPGGDQRNLHQAQALAADAIDPATEYFDPGSFDAAFDVIDVGVNRGVSKWVNEHDRNI